MATNATAQKGLALPAVRTQGGYFASKNPLQCAWGNLLVALYTPIGSRRMSRTFGSGLSTLLFRQGIQRNDPAVQIVVTGSAATWVPSVNITRVVTQVTKKAVNVGITFNVTGAVSQSPFPANTFGAAAGAIQG